MRQRAMASRTLRWVQRSHERFRSMKSAPALRMMSATSNGGRLIYSSSDDLPFFSTSASSGLGGGMQVPLREVEIASGFFQIVMA